MFVIPSEARDLLFSPASKKQQIPRANPALRNDTVRVFQQSVKPVLLKAPCNIYRYSSHFRRGGRYRPARRHSIAPPRQLGKEQDSATDLPLFKSCVGFGGIGKRIGSIDSYR
jgi:hypothetical protein